MDLQDLHALDTSKWNECWQAEQVLFADSKHFCNISRVDRTCYSSNVKWFFINTLDIETKYFEINERNNGNAWHAC